MNSSGMYCGVIGDMVNSSSNFTNVTVVSFVLMCGTYCGVIGYVDKTSFNVYLSSIQ